MPVVINHEPSSEVNLTISLSQYIQVEPFPFDVNKEISDMQFSSYMEYDFNNLVFYKSILRCESSLLSRMLRVFSAYGEDFFKICGGYYESTIKANKIVYFSKEHVYNLLFLNLNKNNFHFNEYKIPTIRLDQRYNFLYNLYFLNEENVNIIKNNTKYKSLFDYQYRSGNVLNVFEGVFIDYGEYFLSYFNGCQIAQIVLNKTCAVKETISRKTFSSAVVHSELFCEENIAQFVCTDLNSMLSLFSEPKIVNKKQQVSLLNKDVHSNVKFDHSGAIAALIMSICGLIASIFVLCVLIYKKLCLGKNFFSKNNLDNTKENDNLINNHNNEILLDNIQSIRENSYLLSS